MVETRWKTWTEKEREALLSLLDTEPTRGAIKEAVSTLSKRFGLAGIRSIKSTFHMALLGVNKMCGALSLPLREVVPDPKSLSEHGAQLPQYLSSAPNKNSGQAASSIPPDNRISDSLMNHRGGCRNLWR